MKKCHSTNARQQEVTMRQITSKEAVKRFYSGERVYQVKLIPVEQITLQDLITPTEFVLPGRKTEEPKEWLKEVIQYLYLTRDMTMEQIAEDLRCDIRDVSYMIRAFGFTGKKYKGRLPSGTKGTGVYQSSCPYSVIKGE